MTKRRVCIVPSLFIMFSKYTPEGMVLIFILRLCVSDSTLNEFSKIPVISNILIVEASLSKLTLMKSLAGFGLIPRVFTVISSTSVGPI